MFRQKIEIIRFYIIIRIHKSNILSGHKEEWDELERSIVANLADDVTVGVRNQKVRLTVIKTF